MGFFIIILQILFSTFKLHNSKSSKFGWIVMFVSEESARYGLVFTSINGELAKSWSVSTSVKGEADGSLLVSTFISGNWSILGQSPLMVQFFVSLNFC